MNALHQHRDATFRLTALVDLANGLLPRLTAASDGRVATAFDARGVRYYQSIGVVQKPLRYEGRAAIYGYTHVLQLICAKALQGKGLKLAQVQRALAGASLAQLESAAAEALGEPAPAAPAPAYRTVITAELAPGVTVTLDPAHVADVDALLARLARAAAPQSGAL